MLTDAQLMKKTKAANYVVFITSKHKDAPFISLSVAADNVKAAREFGHEYALRILRCKARGYRLSVQKVKHK